MGIKDTITMLVATLDDAGMSGEVRDRTIRRLYALAQDATGAQDAAWAVYCATGTKDAWTAYFNAAVVSDTADKAWRTACANRR